jgi:hypothetical protein
VGHNGFTSTTLSAVQGLPQLTQEHEELRTLWISSSSICGKIKNHSIKYCDFYHCHFYILLPWLVHTQLCQDMQQGLKMWAASFTWTVSLPFQHYLMIYILRRGPNMWASSCTWTVSLPLQHYLTIYILRDGPGSSVGIATVRESNPGGTRFSTPVQTGPGAHPVSCAMGTVSFPGVKSSRGVMLTLQLLLVTWSWKSRAICLLPLWAVQPVQSLSACTRVHFTKTINCYGTIISNSKVPIQGWPLPFLHSYELLTIVRFFVSL